jgi:hypothetical protein
MKNFIIPALTLLTLILFACSHTKSKKTTDENSRNNPLVGAWLLISGKYYTPNRDSLIGQTNSPDQPSSIKVFSTGHFAYISKGENGLNTAGSAGPYKIEGNKYIETHDWLGSTYDQRFLGSTSTYEFKIKGDTLFTSGTIRSVHKNGQEIKDHIQMEEIRIRVMEN